MPDRYVDYRVVECRRIDTSTANPFRDLPNLRKTSKRTKKSKMQDTENKEHSKNLGRFARKKQHIPSTVNVNSVSSDTPVIGDTLNVPPRGPTCTLTATSAMPM